MRYGGKVCRFTEPKKSEAMCMQLKNTKNCIRKFFCLCVYQHNEFLNEFKWLKQCRHRQWLQLKHRPLLAMHKYAHFRKSSCRGGGHNFLILFFFALVSEEPSPQCMCNVCTIQQHICSSETEAGLKPLTRDPTRPDPDAFWPGDMIRSLSVHGDVKPY